MASAHVWWNKICLNDKPMLILTYFNIIKEIRYFLSKQCTAYKIGCSPMLPIWVIFLEVTLNVGLDIFLWKRGAYCLGLDHPPVSVSIQKRYARVFNFHKGIPHQKITDRYIFDMKIKKKKLFYYFLVTMYCPLQIWTLKTCNKDISETIIASGLKFGQLIEDDE